jgi:hypothetical protein
MKMPWRKLRALLRNPSFCFILLHSGFICLHFAERARRARGTPTPRFPWWERAHSECVVRVKKGGFRSSAQQIRMSFYRPPRLPRHWYPAYTCPPKLFLTCFLQLHPPRRQVFPQGVLYYGQAGKRRGDLLTGDRGHHPEILGYCWMTVCRSGLSAGIEDNSALISRS